MKKYMLLVLTILSFIVFQYNFSNSSKAGFLGGVQEQTERDLNYIYNKVPSSDFSIIKYWMYLKKYKTHNDFFPIELLFQTNYGYIFLGLFTLSGYLIKPRKVWIPVSIGIYIGLAMLFTVI